MVNKLNQGAANATGGSTSVVFTGLDKTELNGLEAYMKEKGVKVEREEKRGWEGVVDEIGDGDMDVSDDSRSQVFIQFLSN